VEAAQAGRHHEPGPEYEPRSRLRRLVEVTGFWAVYCGLGEALGLGSSIGELTTYLLLSVPLVLFFQVLVARRDVRELWVKTAPRVFTRLMAIIALAVAIYPVIFVIKAIADGDPASLVIYGAVAIAGAGAAGYAFGLFTRETFRFLLLCVLFATGYSVLIDVITSLELEGTTHPVVIRPEQDLEMFITSLLGLIPIVFMLEEVVFRGALDSHLHRPGERHGVWTAIYISVLWSLWHAPVFGWDNFDNYLIGMVPMGVALSIFWRRSGNLGVSGSAHALGDAFRNATTGVP
jgi:membrane protease YdiL (CAAX protease family)